MFTALFLLSFPQDLPDLLRDLGSDSVRLRGEAERMLERLGPDAVPALRQAASAGDPELRSRAAAVLERVARAERRRPVRPRDRRLTLRLDGAPFSEAIERALGPFGITGVADARRPVSLDVHDAGFWDVLEALEQAAGQRLDLMEGTWDAAAPSRSGAMDARVAFDSWKEDGTELIAGVWLPPGFWMPDAAAEEVELHDAQGRLVASDAEIELHGPRTPGFPSRQALLRVEFNAARPGPFTLRGTVLLRLPRDIERLETPAGRFPADVDILGGRVRIETLKEAGPDWELTMHAFGGQEAFRYLLAMEDSAGWIEDLHAGAAMPRETRTRRGTIPPPRRPASLLAVYRPLAFDTFRVPFVLEKIPGPKP